MEPLDLSVIIVTYNSTKVISRCIDAVVKSIRSLSFEVILIDNGSLDDTKALAKKNFSKLKIISLKENLGFGKAVNLGEKEAQGSFLLVLNPDVFIKSDIEPVLGFIRSDDRIGAVGIKLISKEATQPYTCGFRYSVVNLALNHLGLGKRPWRRDEPIDVDWVSGAAMFLKKKAFEKVGGFDERFFMFFEDQDLCLRLKEEGFRVVFFPLTSATHLHGRSSGVSSLSMREYYDRSEDLFFEKHFGKKRQFLMRILKYFLRLF